jgi:hypothetical protein
MKSKRPNSLNKTCKTACRVSAAALMLGVSHAATVGFNFQCSYGSYSGAYVTAPAFGIGTNGWESLTQMGNGYGTPLVSPLMEIIDTTTSSDGLNPLPNGSLNVTWSAYTANVSGFGGYAESPPYYKYTGNGHKPGEEEVYWGFLRDGVNFGPNADTGQSDPDNDQPGWTVDITGLKSVFTNSPFVVEMIGAGDSIENLTNVFIVDATLSTTQSVSYPNIPPISNVGDTPWPRGIGGGLSIGSGPVDTDHLQIIGNRAQHSAGPPAFNNASEVAGFIITDKPVITMSPQSVLVSPGDVVTLRAIAIGVPPLSLQWRNNGVAVPGATNLSYVISNSVAGAGNYDLAVTNNYGFAISKVAAVTLDQLNIASGAGYTMDSNPSGPRHDAEVLGATILASSTDSLGTNRMGVAHFVATDPDQIVVPTVNTTDLDATNCTIMFWMRFSGTVNASKETILFDRRTTSGVTVVISQLGTIGVQDSAPSSVEFYGSTDVTDNNWHHVAVVNDNVNGLEIYVDGLLENDQGSPDSWSWPAGQQIELGLSHSSSFVPYNGDLDDFRFYNRNLTGTEVASVYNTDAMVDSAALKLWLNFSSADLYPGIKVSWQNSDATLQSAGSITGPWNNLPTATSPFSQETGSTQTFFRYIHTPVTFQSNPYDM